MKGEHEWYVIEAWTGKRGEKKRQGKKGGDWRAQPNQSRRFCWQIDGVVW